MTTFRSRRTATAILVSTLVTLAVACSQTSDVERAQATVKAKEQQVAEAQAAYEKSRAGFCNDAGVYIAALDRYSKVFTTATATVGDVRTLGSDLERPRGNVATAAQSAVDAQAELSKANAELATAQANLKSLEAGSSTTAAPKETTTSTTLLPTASVDRIRTEEADLTAALGSISDQTPLVQAGQQVNAAAFALQAAWMRVVSEAGCLTADQAAQADKAITQYTAAVQSALKVSGHYTGTVDGIYGPATVDAVKKLQAQHQLPQTGYVDIATARALQSSLQQQGGTAAAQAIAATAAVQSTLKLAGYWHGAVDGTWTDELTASLEAFQTALGVPATGIVDTATMAALQQRIAEAAKPDTTTTGPSPTSSATTGSTTTSTP